MLYTQQTCSYCNNYFIFISLEDHLKNYANEKSEVPLSLKNKKPFNEYIDKYNTIRSVVRYLYIYGCYSRDDLENSVMSGRKYDNELLRLRQLYRLKAYKGVLQEKKVGKRKINRLKYTPFSTVDNFLIESYRLKTFTSNDLTLFFHTQQILHSNTRPLSRGSILDALDKLGLTHIQGNTLHRNLNSMTTLGVLQSQTLGREKVYSISEDPFREITTSDLLNLYLAVDFFANTTFPRVLGYFLKRMLYHYLVHERQLDPGPDAFLFQHNPLHDVLEEEVVWHILQAMELHKTLRLVYATRKRESITTTVQPLKLIMDSRYGRWYLLAQGEYPGPSVYSLNRIDNIQTLDKEAFLHDTSMYEQSLSRSWGVSLCPPNSAPTSVILRFVAEPHEIPFVLRRVKREGKWGQVSEVGSTEFFYRIEITDLSGITPWIRSFGHRAEVLEPISLRLKFKQDWQEMLQNYLENNKFNENL